MDFKRLNNITGWLVFLIALITYVITIEDTAGFWDVGEFTAVSYKLMVPHPPGAPFFLLLGRMASFLSMGDVHQVAYWINMISVVASAFTILFMFWSITLFSRKLLKSRQSILFLLGKLSEFNHRFLLHYQFVWVTQINVSLLCDQDLRAKNSLLGANHWNRHVGHLMAKMQLV